MGLQLYPFGAKELNECHKLVSTDVVVVGKLDWHMDEFSGLVNKKNKRNSTLLRHYPCFVFSSFNLVKSRTRTRYLLHPHDKGRPLFRSVDIGSFDKCHENFGVPSCMDSHSTTIPLHTFLTFVCLLRVRH